MIVQWFLIILIQEAVYLLNFLLLDTYLFMFVKLRYMTLYKFRKYYYIKRMFVQISDVANIKLFGFTGDMYCVW